MSRSLVLTVQKIPYFDVIVYYIPKSRGPNEVLIYVQLNNSFIFTFKKNIFFSSFEDVRLVPMGDKSLNDDSDVVSGEDYHRHRRYHLHHRFTRALQPISYENRTFLCSASSTVI